MRSLRNAGGQMIVMMRCCSRVRRFRLSASLVVVACAVGNNAMAEQRLSASQAGPTLSKFLGIWIRADVENTACRRDDWKEKSDNGPMISVTASAVEMLESGCKILSSRPRGPELKAIDVKLSCSGEGFTWKSSEIWQVQSLGDRRVFVQTEVKTTNRRDDAGKRYPTPRSEEPTTLYLECK